MAEVLLVHGSGHGAWCWHRITPELQALGLKARAIDLPGRTPLPVDITLQDQADAILASLTGPTLLVGHSAGGYPITAAAEAEAEADPARITGLVYLCAYAPASGRSMAQMRRDGPAQPLAGAIRLTPDRSRYSFDPDRTTALFYHDCGPEDRALAARHLCPEPITPQETPLALTARSQDLPRHYIRCEDDRTIPPALQQQMALSVPPQNRHALPCGHSPFFAAPTETARLIAKIAATLPA